MHLPTRRRRQRRLSRAARSALAVAALSLIVATGAPAESLCLAIIALPENDTLAAVPLYAEGATFIVSYKQAATGAPIKETYRANRTGLTQIEIRFEQQGPGLPTQPGPGETWVQEQGQTVVTLARPFDGVRMRVRADQAPMLDVAGRKTVLSQWGDRAIGIVPSDCTLR